MAVKLTTSSKYKSKQYITKLTLLKILTHSQKINHAWLSCNA